MGFEVARGAEQVFGGTVIQRLGISVGKLFKTILFFSLQIVPAFQLGLTLRAHQPLLSSFPVCRLE